jgi:hypothetical protein
MVALMSMHVRKQHHLVVVGACGMLPQATHLLVCGNRDCANGGAHVALCVRPAWARLLGMELRHGLLLLTFKLCCVPQHPPDYQCGDEVWSAVHCACHRVHSGGWGRNGGRMHTSLKVTLLHWFDCLDDTTVQHQGPRLPPM